MRTNTKPRGVIYGGSQDAQDALTQEYGSGIDQGNSDYSAGTAALDRTGSAAKSFGQQASVLTSSAGTAPSTYTQSAGTGILAGYQPGQVAATQQQQALDQGALQNIGAARGGGALGLRNALVANAGSNVQAAQAAAAQRAQEQQAYVGAQVNQANNDQATQMQADQFGQQQMVQQQQVGLNAQAQAIGLASTAASNQAQLGLTNQGQYLDQQQNVYDSQNQNNETYEAQRQAAAKAKADRLSGWASGLMSVSAKAFGGIGGGG